jgi:type VI secretion system VasD/TssJ family lipoprotein
MSSCNHRMSLLAVTISLPLLVALVGCAPPTIRARGVQPLNLNPVNESTPVDVRFYQLTDDQAFMTAPFEGLWTDASAALGGNLLGRPVIKTVYPATLGDNPVTLQLTKLEDGANFIGVLALFRGNDGSARQVAVGVNQLDDGVLELTGYGIRFNTGAAPTPQPTTEKDEGKPVETEEERAKRKQEEDRRYQTPDDKK